MFLIEIMTEYRTVGRCRTDGCHTWGCKIEKMLFISFVSFSVY